MTKPRAELDPSASLYLHHHVRDAWYIHTSNPSNTILVHPSIMDSISIHDNISPAWNPPTHSTPSLPTNQPSMGTMGKQSPRAPRPYLRLWIDHRIQKYEPESLESRLRPSGTRALASNSSYCYLQVCRLRIVHSGSADCMSVHGARPASCRPAWRDESRG